MTSVDLRFYLFASLMTASYVEVAWARKSMYERVPGTCRMESQLYLEPHLFSQLTCARCYKYMPSLAFKNASRLTYCRGGRLCRGECGGECFQPYGNGSDARIVETFKKGFYADRWNSCCLAAQECCREMLEDELADPATAKEGPHCPATWDGWTCYKDTPAETTVHKPCPAHAYFITEQPQCIKMSKKTCWQNGTWFYSQEYGKEYTFYDCGSLEYHRSMTIFSIVLHSLSVVVLVPAIIIFSVYKQLQVHRIALHKNFCLAMVLYDISVILVDSVFILDHVNEEKNIRVNENPNLCKVLYTLSRYFRLCQYAWMFCEGFYLHRLITSAFAEQKSLLVFYVIGWGCPAIFVAISAALRALRTGHPCWMDNIEGYNWITLAPGLFCLFANFVFLCNIIRVLVTKLRSTHASEPSQFRKAVRAVLVLFPLFGMHFLMTVYRSPANCGAWEVYQYISKASDGLQGFFVAVIFCYFNGEVQGQITRSIELVKLESSLTRACDRRRSTRTQVLAC
ncbi:calcitonin gene-related peptide type 1 receptor-like isoform X1 [Dermacentor albipictus]|uniref:calcitonin gene-related peptide type 1 receptor-like isoform X1 n=2 Tax=Dermacentor albipictus TaxID=60249 RepID=UPI0038FCB7DB